MALAPTDEAIAACLRDTTPAALIALGHIADPRAVLLLLQCVRFQDWRVRRLAVRSLARHDVATAIAAVDRAAREDCSLAVRVEAGLAVLHRDADRGRRLLTEMLGHPHVTPLLTEQIQATLRGET